MENISKRFIEREESFLSPYAFLTSNTKGRLHPYEPCSIRTEFQRDRDRIIHSKSFRRLMHKTQVFFSPADEHYRTRMTHTLEVTQIARIIARALRLNEDLSEAVALGHDLGHTPFGHAGEVAMQRCFDKNFTHYEQSLRVVDFLEKDGQGLNLTYEVRDGIVMISKSVGEVLTKLGVEEVGKVGEVFDPNLHNAVMHEDDDTKGEGEITEVFQKGYKKGKRVIRFAMVKSVN